ncbi:unnamed protein product [Dibothriocephalus latus]|uniref:Nucleoside diphosphate kinase-like domain-containing protein n=1 Tax=Dibothriocephalus latus TaxID=60516 RepID=A0A3P7QYF1_DIBLA|nr:unnamed protein product [Dibothriocephalus latus]
MGEIWASIQEKGFCVVAAQVFRLSKVDAGEFLEVYKGVIAEYPEVVEELTSGPCVAMQIAGSYKAEAFDPNRGPDDPQSVQHRFREFAGPMDPVSFIFDFFIKIFCGILRHFTCFARLIFEIPKIIFCVDQCWKLLPSLLSTSCMLLCISIEYL